MPSHRNDATVYLVAGLNLFMPRYFFHLEDDNRIADKRGLTCPMILPLGARAKPYRGPCGVHEGRFGASS
jgi:hypothetical protein